MYDALDEEIEVDVEHAVYLEILLPSPRFLARRRGSQMATFGVAATPATPRYALSVGAELASD